MEGRKEGRKEVEVSRPLSPSEGQKTEREAGKDERRERETDEEGERPEKSSTQEGSIAARGT